MTLTTICRDEHIGVDREYLGEATCASRTEAEFPGSGLGDRGFKTLLSICRALSIPVGTEPLEVGVRPGA